VRPRAVLWVPFAFGLWSLALGADHNWDLYNYHLYNPFALLEGKHGIDFAPGGLQSFFNPLLDVPGYLAITHLPSRLVGFLMGLLHGANFVLLLAIARRALPAGAPPGAPFWLALAGMLTGNFLSELGNTMGDNATALGVLGALLLVLQSWRTDRGLPLATAGLLAGIATGLKLTNAPYAMALCAALLVLPLPLPRRARLALLFAAGAIAGFAVTGGWWLLRMWDAFGNPLFPQFGSVFPNPLAASISIADRAWVPKAWWQHLAWPFVISFDARRAGQLGLRQVIWALVYAAFLAWALAAVWRRGRPADRAPLDGSARVVLFLVAAGFVAWMEVFGIYRYLVPIELLAPLAIFLVASARWPMRKAVRASRGVLVVATFVALAGMKTWGHAGWRDPLLHFDVPPLAEPARTTVLIAGGDPPWSWLAVGFPRDVAFFQLGGNFPEGPRFRAMIGERIAERGGPVFAVVTGHHDARVDEGKPARRDIPAENRAEREKAARLLAAYRFTLRPEACSEHRAGIGAEVQVFQWCPLS
jgi:glycosyl transferase family 87